MATAANLVLADGQATPVNATFSVESITPQLSQFVDRASGVAAKYRRISVSYVPANVATKKTKAGLKISIPVWGILPSGSEGVLRTLRSNVELDEPDGCTDAERKDLFAFTVNALANTLVKGALRDNDPIY
jgi:hypothetical protein